LAAAAAAIAARAGCTGCTGPGDRRLAETTGGGMHVATEAATVAASAARLLRIDCRAGPRVAIRFAVWNVLVVRMTGIGSAARSVPAASRTAI